MMYFLRLMSEYVHRACEKLRAQQSHAKQLTVFLPTSPFSDRNTEPNYANSALGQLIYPSSDTRDFLHLATELLTKIWKEGYRYAKSGVMLTDFYDEGIRQQQLFANKASSKSDPALMAVIDQINQQHNRNAIYFAAKGTKLNWSMRRSFLAFTIVYDLLERNFKNLASC